MARFEDAINYVMENEGGYSDHPHDPGGETLFGISLSFLKSEGWDLDDDGDIDGDDVRSLTLEDAKALFRSSFWNALSLDLVESQPIATRTLDMAVNMGRRAAVKLLQRAANEFAEADDLNPNPPELLVVDGQLGPKTLAAVNLLARIDTDKLMQLVRRNHELFYWALVETRPDLRYFLQGWLSRARRA